MKITIFPGKGGVGKTTCGVSFALKSSQHTKTAIIDYDGGHSVKETLGITTVVPGNELHKVRPNLFLGIIQNVDFNSIEHYKEGKEKDPFSKYMDQFPEDQGIIPFADMVNDFFGVPTDIETTQKFIFLVSLLSECRTYGVEHVIIDMEPTAGLERFLHCSNSTVRSLNNLKNKGWILKKAVQFAWPDIYRYLESRYIENIDFFTDRILSTAELIKNGRYILVCTPERSPVQQSFEVRELIEKFGGTITGYVVNNIRHELHESAQLQIIQTQKLPTVYLKRESDLHQEEDTLLTLFNIGTFIEKTFPLKEYVVENFEDPVE